MTCAAAAPGRKVAPPTKVGRHRANGPPRGTVGISNGASRNLPAPPVARPSRCHYREEYVVSDSTRREAEALLACAHAIQAARLTLPTSSAVGPRLASLAANLADCARTRGGTSLRLVERGA